MAHKHHILLLGGTGLCGQLFTRAALDAGHQLTLYVRSPSKLSFDLAEHANLQIIEGTYDDIDGLAKAATCGADTFISLAGPTLGKREGRPITNALHRLYPLLLDANPQIRIMVLSTASYSAPQDTRSIKWFFAINGYVRVIGGDSYIEIKGIADETVALGDRVEWTVFRVPLLSGKELPIDGRHRNGINTVEGEKSKGTEETHVEPESKPSASNDTRTPQPDDSQTKNEEIAKVHAAFVGNKMGWDGLFLDRGRLVTWILGELEEEKWLRLCPILANA